MSEYLTNTNELTSIADAIREKTGSNGLITYPTGFVSEIESIETGGGEFPPDKPWTLPSNYPDLDELTYEEGAGEVYFVMDKSLNPDATQIASTNVAKMEVGHIENGEFIADYGHTGEVILLSNIENDIFVLKFTITSKYGMYSDNNSAKLVAVCYVNLPTTLDSSFGFSRFVNAKKIKIISMWKSSVNGMFNGCYSLQSLDLSGLDTSNATDMTNMFYNCYSIQSLDLSNFDTSSVTNMLYMFYHCVSLQSLDLSNFDTSSVTDMGYMFDTCSSIQSLDLSSFDTSSVTNMNYMFADCDSLQSLDLSSFDTSSVTDMGYMFRCKNLKILIPPTSGFTTNFTNFGTYALFSRGFFKSSFRAFMQALPTITDTKTLKFYNSYNKAPEDIAIATDKGWTITFNA